MAIALLWWRSSLPWRWQGWLSLGLLVALTSAVVLTAVAGARRGATAVDRLRAVTLPADVVVVPNRPGFNWDALRKAPEVEALTTFPGYTSLPVLEAPSNDLTSFIPADSDAMDAIERPVVLQGRRADPTRSDEAVVTAAFVHTFHRGVGDTVTLQLMTPHEADVNAQTGAVTPSGPRVRVRIVGVIRSAWYIDDAGARGSLIPSPGVVDRYRTNLLGAAGSVPTSGLVRLRDGPAAIGELRRDLARVGGHADVDIVDRADSTDRARKVITLESTCLLAFAVAALLAALVVLGQVVSRHTAGDAAAMRSLAALGLTRRQASWIGALGPATAALVGALTGIVVAVEASRWMPFGIAATWEPHPGLEADWVVLGAGATLLVGYVGFVAATATRTRLRRSGWERERPPSPVVRALAAMGFPVPVILGAQFSLKPGRGSRTGAVRPAIVGSVVGVAGVVAAFTFSTAVADAQQHPERFGQNYQFLAVLGCCGQDFVPAHAVLAAIAKDPDVAAVTNLRVAVGTSGGVSIVARTFDPVGAAVPLVLTNGTAPSQDSDVVLAPATARLLHAVVGSRVPLSGDRGSRYLRVSGIGFGVQTSTSFYDSGAWLLPGAYDRLFRGFQEHGGMLALRPGARPEVALPRLQRLAAEAAGTPDALITPPFVPVQTAEIRDLRALPQALGYLLVALAIGGVGQTLGAAVRSRSGEISVLRALGMTPRQARGVIRTQAVGFAAVALVVGFPLGLALGRTLWRVAAAIMPLQYRTPFPSTAALLVGPAVFAAALLLAVVPARRAARLRISDALRAE